MPKKVLLTGGGTLGSVTPLLAIKEEIQKQQKGVEFFWIGTKSGPEKKVVQKEGVEFWGIFSGKLRRYFDWRNFVDPFFIGVGLIESFFILRKIKPDVIITAGSFVSVPVSLAGAVLGIPTLVHQLDVRPGLANKIMSLWAKRITVGFSQSLTAYPSSRAVWTGNPLPLWAKELKKQPNLPVSLDNDLPVVLVMGGGTGAKAINELLEKILPSLVKIAQVIHLTGVGKSPKLSFPNYYAFPFLDHKDILALYPRVDLAVARAGLGTLLELAFFGKPALLIPIPSSHQEDNARLLHEQKAALVLDQDKLTPEELLSQIKKILYNKNLKDTLSQNIKKIVDPRSGERIVREIKRIW